MATVSVDRRSREVRAAPKAERAARHAFAELARAEVRAARALATIEQRRSYVLSGHASVMGWAQAAGLGPQQARRLLALARSLRAAPELGAKVFRGRIPAESVVSIGRVLTEPTLDLAPSQQAAWIGKAETVAPAHLRDAAERTVEEARQGAPTLPLRFMVTKDTKDGFHRARLLMARGEARTPTEGEALGNLVTEFLARNDPRARELPRRRRGPTGEGERDRYLPRRVKAIVERRSGGTCEVCRTRRAREKIHLRVPHAKGGSREADNIADACRDCHVLVDAGVFVFSCFDETDGRPRFQRGAGQPPGAIRERAPPYRAGRGTLISRSRRTRCSPIRGTPS
ncbi:MAG: HNH endonuclease [Planctomycetota bacterium]|jgi:hypothetical protein